MNSSDDELDRRADERVDAAAVADLADFPMRAAAGSFGSDDEQSDGGGSVGGDIDRIRSRVAAQRRGEGDDDPAAAAAAADIRQRFSTFKPESKHDVVSPPVKRVDSFNWDGVQIGGAGSSPGNVVVGIGGSAVGVTGAAGTSSPRHANGLPSGIPKPASLSNKGKSQSARGPNPSSSPFLSKSPAGNSGPAGGDASDRLEAMPQPTASLGTGPAGSDAMQAKLMELARRNKQLTLALHREKEKAIRSAAEANSLQVAASAAAGADGTRKGAGVGKPAFRKGNTSSRSATGGDQHVGDDGYAMGADVRRQHQQQHPSASSSPPSSEPMTALQQSEALVRQLNGALQKAQRTSERAMIELRVTHRILQKELGPDIPIGRLLSLHGVNHSLVAGEWKGSGAAAAAAAGTGSGDGAGGAQANTAGDGGGNGVKSSTNEKLVAGDWRGRAQTITLLRTRVKTLERDLARRMMAAQAQQQSSYAQAQQAPSSARRDGASIDGVQDAGIGGDDAASHAGTDSVSVGELLLQRSGNVAGGNYNGDGDAPFASLELDPRSGAPSDAAFGLGLGDDDDHAGAVGGGSNAGRAGGDEVESASHLAGSASSRVTPSKSGTSSPAVPRHAQRHSARGHAPSSVVSQQQAAHAQAALPRMQQQQQAAAAGGVVQLDVDDRAVAVVSARDNAKAVVISRLKEQLASSKVTEERCKMEAGAAKARAQILEADLKKYKSHIKQLLSKTETDDKLIENLRGELRALQRASDDMRGKLSSAQLHAFPTDRDGAMGRNSGGGDGSGGGDPAVAQRTITALKQQIQSLRSQLEQQQLHLGHQAGRGAQSNPAMPASKSNGIGRSPPSMPVDEWSGVDVTGGGSGDDEGRDQHGFYRPAGHAGAGLVSGTVSSSSSASSSARPPYQQQQQHHQQHHNAANQAAMSMAGSSSSGGLQPQPQYRSYSRHDNQHHHRQQQHRMSEGQFDGRGQHDGRGLEGGGYDEEEEEEEEGEMHGGHGDDGAWQAAPVHVYSGQQQQPRSSYQTQHQQHLQYAPASSLSQSASSGSMGANNNGTKQPASQPRAAYSSRGPAEEDDEAAYRRQHHHKQQSQGTSGTPYGGSASSSSSDINAPTPGFRPQQQHQQQLLQQYPHQSQLRAGTGGAVTAARSMAMGDQAR